MIQDNTLRIGGAGNAQLASVQPLAMFGQTQLGQQNNRNSSNCYSVGMPPDSAAPPTWFQNASATRADSLNPWQQMLAAIQSLIAQLRNGAAPAPTAVDDGTFSSWGDPHLALTGNGFDAHGNPITLNAQYDSMVGHSDLLNSGDIAGGFQISTAVTTPRPDGVTSNGSATYRGNYGNDIVRMNADGTTSIRSDGQAIDLANGASVLLDGGATVTKNTDGSLTIAASTVDGRGTLTTTFKTNGGGGVDVSGHASDVAVGGDLVNRANAAGPATPQAPQPQQQTANTSGTNGGSAILPWASVQHNADQYSAIIDGAIATANVVGSQSSGLGTFTTPGANLSGSYEIQDPSSPTGDIFLRGNGRGVFGWGTTQSTADQLALQNASLSTQWYADRNAT